MAFVSTSGQAITLGTVELVLKPAAGMEVSVLSSRCFGADGAALNGAEPRLVTGMEDGR
jgi:hypothetical protein